MRAPEHAETLAAGLEDAAPTSGAESGVLVAGRYRVLELVGSGGMGTVYKAHDTELDEIVALKTLRREVLDTPGALERFKREVKLARKVTHRSIARVFDVGEAGAGGEKFLTMEFVSGRSLGRVLSERGALPPSEVVSLGTAIAAALAAAHAAGVVHRDLKPDNVLIEESGRVVLTDFGVARAMEAGGDARATGAGGIVGTPAYMAPEQVEGAAIDGRTDLYALGVLLFELLTGELPFEGETPLAVAVVRLVRAPRELAALRPDLPAALVEVVKRALARSPEGRFASAEALGAALASAVSTTTLTRPASIPPPSIVEERRIAVVPFRAATPDDVWMAEGLVEDLGDALSMLHGVRVRARAGAPTEGEDLRAYGRRNGVEALVEGSVQREGERFRARLRLVSAEDGFQIWAQRFTGTTGELLRVSDEAARAIAHALAGATAPAVSRPAPSAEAVELYLRAKQLSASFSGLEEAGNLFERAAALAPDDPRILSAHAIMLAHEVFRPGAPADLVVRARQAAERTMVLAPHQPESHVAMARFHHASGDDVAAMQALLRARVLGPSVAEVDDLIGRLLSERDMHEQAVRHLERAVWIQPTLLFARVDLSRLYAFRGDWGEVERQLAAMRRVSAEHQALVGARLVLWGGHPDWITGPITTGNAGIDVYNELLLRGVRDRRLDDTAWQKLDTLVAGTPPMSRPRRLFTQLMAELRSALGHLDEGETAVLRAVDAGLVDLAWMRHCPVLAPIRARPAIVAATAVVAERARGAADAYRAGIA